MWPHKQSLNEAPPFACIKSFFDSAEEISQSEKILTIFFLYNSTQTISVLLDLTLKAQSFFFLNKVYILQYGSIISRLYFLPGRVL